MPDNSQLQFVGSVLSVAQLLPKPAATLDPMADLQLSVSQFRPSVLRLIPGAARGMREREAERERGQKGLLSQQDVFWFQVSMDDPVTTVHHQQ